MADPRQPIGVNQPPNGGTNYPFVRPSSDIQDLLGDVYLSYPDDSFTYAYPLRIEWLYRFGTTSVTPPAGYPTPTHAHDVIIKDANDVTVFDSTLADNYDTHAWGDRLLIIEWEEPDDHIVCRCTKFVGWDSFSTDFQEYDEYIVPSLIDPDGTPGGILDPRTYNKLPQRLTSITTGITTMKGHVTLEGNYNIALEVNPAEIGLADLSLADLGLTTATSTLVPGTRVSNRILISAEAGSGAGAFPSCVGTEPVVRRVTGGVANAWGNLTFDPGNACLRSQRPVGLTDHYPREFAYATTQPVEPEAAIEVLNDCAPCCDCDYFARTYQGLKRQWFGYQDIATDGLGARDQHQANIERWHAAKECRENDPLRLVVAIQPDCKTQLGISFGNTSECCLVGVHMRFTLFFERDGHIMTKEEQASDPCFNFYDCSQTLVEATPQESGPVPYSLAGAYPTFEAVVDYLSPGDVGRVAFKICHPGCKETDRIFYRTDIFWEDVLTPEGYPPCSYPTVEVPSDIINIWTAGTLGVPAQPVHFTKTSIERPLNPLNAFCSSCECPEIPGSESISC